MLKDTISTYRVTYDSYDEAFIVWREARGLPNMIFRMHSSGLHFFYDPNREEFSFVVTVDDNMKMFSKRQIVGAEKARNLHGGLAFPSETDFKWILKSNQVQEFHVTTEDAGVAQKVWGTNVALLKGKMTQQTPPAVQTDIIEIPTALRKTESVCYIVDRRVLHQQDTIFYHTKSKDMFLHRHTSRQLKD